MGAGVVVMNKNKEAIKRIAEDVSKAKLAKRSAEIPAKDKRKSLQSYALPQNCPVKCLGMKDGVYYYMDANHQFRSLAAGKHSRLEIMALFGNQASLLCDYWPRWKTNKDGSAEVIGWQPELAAQALMEDCATEGLIDLSESVRGAGCWRHGNSLLQHCGDKLFLSDEVLQSQKIGEYVYPSSSTRPYPANAADVKAAQSLLNILKTWNWARSEIDPYLMLGWIGAAILGGALEWRPMVWVTGDKGTGKSTLQKVIKDVLGRGGLIPAVDASAAGLWQSLGHSSLPVALDEVESEEDNRRNNNLLKLARIAASGGQMLRGGSDHKQASFTVRSCFLFSSILIPPLLGQDVSRMARLELRPLDKSMSPPKLIEKELLNMGAIFRKQVQEQWPRFDDTLSKYKEAMRRAGHGGRGCDQFGTLLTCADLLLYEMLPDTDSLEEWTKHMDAETLHETSDDVADWERCLEHLLTAHIEVYRAGTRKTVSQWISEAAGYRHADEMAANDALTSYGMKVFKKEGVAYLRVAASHRALSKLFEGSQWAGRAGASGVWAQSLRRAPNAQNLSGLRFNGVKTQVVQLPLDDVVSKNGG